MIENLVKILQKPTPMMLAHKRGVVFAGEVSINRVKSGKYTSKGRYNSKKYVGMTPREKIATFIFERVSVLQRDLRNGSVAYNDMDINERSAVLHSMVEEGLIELETLINPYNKVRSTMIHWVGEE